MNLESALAEVLILELLIGAILIKDGCLKKASKFIDTFMIWGCLSVKEPEDMTIIDVC